MKKVVKNISQSLALFLTFTLILPNPSPPQGLGGSLCQRLFSVGDFAFRVENGGQSEITQRLLRTGLEEPQIPPPTIPAAQDQQASLAEAQVALRKLATAYTTYYGAFTDLVHSRRPGIPEELTLAKERILELAGANAEKVNSQLDVYDRNLNRAISDENAKRLPRTDNME